MYRTSHFKPLLLIVLLVLCVGVALAVVTANSQSPQTSPTPTPAPSGEETRIEGQLTCLPHKDRTGPTTLECAFGLKTAGDLYYALDTTAFFPSIVQETPMDIPVAVSGTLTPVSEIDSSNRITIYDIEGVLLVSDLERL